MKPELARVLDDVLRKGNVLVVWKLDRLARSMKKLITTAEGLVERGIGLVSLTESTAVDNRVNSLFTVIPLHRRA